MKEGMEKETEIMKFEEYLIDADPENLRCVDERKQKDGKQSNAVQLPGGVYYILDACKRLLGDTEEMARNRVINTGIKPDVHTDDHHHEDRGKGCGYAGKVENKPEAVGAKEKVSANDRYEWALENGGNSIELTGEHKPKFASMNYISGKTIDSTKAMNEGNGTFSIDIWYLKKVAEKLEIEEEKLIEDAVVTFKKTVTELSGITQFNEISQDKKY